MFGSVWDFVKSFHKVTNPITWNKDLNRAAKNPFGLNKGVLEKFGIEPSEETDQFMGVKPTTPFTTPMPEAGQYKAGEPGPYQQSAWTGMKTGGY